MSRLSWEAYDRLDVAMKFLRDSMSYVPHRFGSLRGRHDKMAKAVANLSTDLSQYDFMFDGEPAKARKGFIDLRKAQRARIKVKSW